MCWREKYLFIVLMLMIIPIICLAIQPEGEQSKYRESLNGDWKFQLIKKPAGNILDNPYSKIKEQNFNWDNIKVPSNWETEGFGEPRYNAPKDSIYGLYKKEFEIPEKWENRHVILYFEGVSFNYKVWVNEERAGKFHSAYNRSQIDISNQLLHDSVNTITILVHSEDDYTGFDLNDAWALSGIYRDVYLYSPPNIFIEDHNYSTSIGKKGKTAQLKGEITTGVFQGNEVRDYNLFVSIRNNGKIIQQINKTINWKHKKNLPEPVNYQFQIDNPELWNAEEPNLYTLEIKLKDENDNTIHKLEEKIGLREVSIEDNILKVNNTPIKLRGVCRHEIFPKAGRALREKHWIKDIKLIKKANINAVRCAHYPPHPRFLELTDSLGLYVIDKVPFGFGDEYMNDPAVLSRLLGRAERTIDRDENNPSVITWSIGNEHYMNRNIYKAGEFVKRKDTTRHILYPHNDTPWLGSEWQGVNSGILAPHYLSTIGVNEWAKNDSIKGPVIHTEINHSLDVAFGDFKRKWEIIENSPKMAGAMIWHWSDQGLYRKVKGRDVINSYKDVNALESTSSSLSGDYWINDSTILDSHGQYGTDGIVYANRKPQTDYYQVKKVYSPIKIKEDSIDINSNTENVSLTLQNRYDFTNLNELKTMFELQMDGKTYNTYSKKFDIEPRQSKKVQIPFELPEGKDNKEKILIFKAFDRQGKNIDQHSIKINDPREKCWYTQLFKIEKFKKSRKKAYNQDFPINIKRSSAEIDISKNGKVKIKMENGKVLQGPFVRVGRDPTMAERRNCDNIWEPNLLKNWKIKEKQLYTTENGEIINLKYDFSRPKKKEQTIQLDLELSVTSSGYINVDYSLLPVDCKGYFLELGLSFVSPGKGKCVDWLGKGPYPAYPDKSALSILGFHNIKADSRFFDGNRQNVKIAWFKDDNNKQFGLVSKQDNIGWKNKKNGMTIYHNLKVAGLGTKFRPPRVRIKSEQIDSELQGGFNIITDKSSDIGKTVQKISVKNKGYE